MEYKQIWRFYCDKPVNFEQPGTVVELPSDEAHYAFLVLRLTVGEQVELADGRGWTALATLIQIDKKSVRAELQSSHVATEIEHKLIALVGVTKPSALDEVIQNCTEAGVHTLILFKGERTTSKQEVKLDKIAKQVRELCRITKSPHSMQVQLVDSLTAGLSVLERIFPSSRLFVCDERPAHIADLSQSTQPQSTQHLLTAIEQDFSKSVAFVVGPEASFSLREYERLNAEEASGRARYVTLGPRILRTPAAVAAASYVLSSVFDSRA